MTQHRGIGFVCREKKNNNRTTIAVKSWLPKPETYESLLKFYVVFFVCSIMFLSLQYTDQVIPYPSQYTPPMSPLAGISPDFVSLHHIKASFVLFVFEKVKLNNSFCVQLHLSIYSFDRGETLQKLRSMSLLNILFHPV